MVPPRFAERAAAYYGEAGVPEVNRDNVWNIYLDLLAFFESIEVEDDEELAVQVSQRAAMPAVGDDPDGAEHMDLLNLPRCPPLKHRVVGGEEQMIAGRRVKVGGKLVFIAEEEESLPQGVWSDESSSED